VAEREGWLRWALAWPLSPKCDVGGVNAKELIRYRLTNNYAASIVLYVQAPGPPFVVESCSRYL
jgi:hypothetical protein